MQCAVHRPTAHFRNLQNTCQPPPHHCADSSSRGFRDGGYCATTSFGSGPEISIAISALPTLCYCYAGSHRNDTSAYWKSRSILPSSLPPHNGFTCGDGTEFLVKIRGSCAFWVMVVALADWTRSGRLTSVVKTWPRDTSNLYTSACEIWACNASALDASALTYIRGVLAELELKRSCMQHQSHCKHIQALRRLQPGVRIWPSRSCWPPSIVSFTSNKTASL